jgi:hypothetical protein
MPLVQKLFGLKDELAKLMREKTVPLHPTKNSLDAT